MSGDLGNGLHARLVGCKLEVMYAKHWIAKEGTFLLKNNNHFPPPSLSLSQKSLLACLMVREKSIVKLEKNSWPSSSIVSALLPASNRATGVTVNGHKEPAGSLLAILSL